MKLATVYVRTAHASPPEVARQVAVCIHEAERRGFVVCPEHVFVDDGVGAGRRPQARSALLALRQAVHDLSLDALVVRDLSRLSRNLVELVSLLNELRARGIQVIEAERRASGK